MKKIIGRCSNCGGNVTMPTYFHSVVPPVPTCDTCGAVKKNDLPVIQMERPRRWRIAKNQLSQGLGDATQDLGRYTERLLDELVSMDLFRRGEAQ